MPRRRVGDVWPQDDAADHHADALEGEEQAVGADTAVPGLLDELRQQHLERGVADEQDERERSDRDPEPRHLHHVAEAGRQLAAQAFAGRPLVHARARERDEQRGGDERRRVHGEDRARARDAVDDARDRGPDDERGLARDPHERVRRAEAGVVDEQGEDPAERRLEEPAAEAVQRDEPDQHAEGEVAARVDDRQRGDHQRPRAVRSDQQQLPRVAVREDAADQQRRHEPDRLDHQHDPEGARLARQREGSPAECDDERCIADLRDRLARPEQAEVAVPKRFEDAQARLGAHRRKAILGPCRIGSAWRASR